MQRFYLFFSCSLLVVLLSISLPSCSDNSHIRGKLLYNGYCSNCHMEDGSGLAALIPPLTDIEHLRNHIKRIPCSIKYGIEGPLTIAGIEYNETMPENISLTDTQISEILNYIFQVLNKSSLEITDIEVEEALSLCR